MFAIQHWCCTPPIHNHLSRTSLPCLTLFSLLVFLVPRILKIQLITNGTLIVALHHLLLKYQRESEIFILFA